MVAMCGHEPLPLNGGDCQTAARRKLVAVDPTEITRYPNANDEHQRQKERHANEPTTNHGGIVLQKRCER
jgi:hypothetical protein